MTFLAGFLSWLNLTTNLLVAIISTVITDSKLAKLILDWGLCQPERYEMTSSKHETECKLSTVSDYTQQRRLCKTWTSDKRITNVKTKSPICLKQLRTVILGSTLSFTCQLICNLAPRSQYNKKMVTVIWWELTKFEV